MEMIGEIAVSVLLILGGFFGLVGSFGLVRLPDQMTRLHAPTKSATLGVGAVLLASVIWFPTQHGRFTWHELLIMLFVFLTAPVTGNVIAKANMHINWRPDEIPAPGPGTSWSTYGAPGRDKDDQPGPP